MEFSRVEMYEFRATSYLNDPATTKSYENASSEFSITLAAKDLEDAIVLCREWAKSVPVKEAGYHNSDWDNGRYCVIKGIEHRGNAYIPRRRKAE